MHLQHPSHANSSIDFCVLLASLWPCILAHRFTAFLAAFCTVSTTSAAAASAFLASANYASFFFFSSHSCLHWVSAASSSSMAANSASRSATVFVKVDGSLLKMGIMDGHRWCWMMMVERWDQGITKFRCWTLMCLKGSALRGKYCYAPFHLALQNLQDFHSELKTGIHETIHTEMVFTLQSLAQEITIEHSRPWASCAVTDPSDKSVV